MLALLMMAAAQVAAGQEVLRFDTHGGDAWIFSKVISGTVVRERCDTVAVMTARHRVSVPVASGRFTATVSLLQGNNSVSAVCMRDGRPVGEAARQNWTERLPDIPTARATVTFGQDAVLLDGRTSTMAPGVREPIIRYSWDAAAINPARLESQSIRGSRPTFIASRRGPLLRVRLPNIDGDYRVRLTVTDARGRRDKSTVLFRVTAAGPVAVDALHGHPNWRGCTILYGVAPALLGRHGLTSITRHLDEMAHLGATALWLSPITGAPPGDFGYSLTDPFRVRGDLGSSVDLRALVAHAHALGMHVLLDFVTNHLSKEHPYFKDADRFGRRSPYFDWFERDGSGHPVHYFDWEALENLNYGNEEVRNYMLAAVTHWLREFPVDGFRADAAWAVRERDPAFWPLMREEVERIRPGVLLLAEASARDPYYMSQGFDAAYDWTGELGHWAWEGVFGSPGELPNLRLLRARLTNEGRGFTDSSGVLRFLNNNDTGKRFISAHGLAVTRLAAALLFTVPGIPLVYAGDEVGAAYEPYHHPGFIQWNDPDHLTPLYARLIKMRQETPALRSPTMRLLSTSRDDSVLAYTREGSQPEQDSTVVLNFGDSSFNLQLVSIRARSTSVGAWWAEDLLDGTRTVVPSQAQTVRVAPRSAMLVRHASGGRLRGQSCPRSPNVTGSGLSRSTSPLSSAAEPSAAYE